MIKKIKIAVYKLLKKSEKWTKTDMIYLAKGGFWLTLGQGISSLSSFLLAIAFANLLPKETYGTYKYIMSIVSLLAIPTLAGMNTAIIQAVARGYEGSVMPAFKTKVKWGLLGGLASLILAGYYYFQGNNVLAIAFLITAVFVPFMDSLLIYDSYLNGKKDFKKQSNYNIVIRIVSTIILIITVLLTNNIFLFIASYFTINTLLRLFFFKLTFNNKNLNKEKDTRTISYGKHLSLMNIIGSVAMQIDKILVFHYLGSTEVAIYSIAIAPIDQIKPVFKNIQFLLLPKFASKNIDSIKNNLIQKILKSSIILIFIVILYIIISPFLFKYIFPQYPESVFYTQLYSVSLLTVFMVVPISVLRAHNKKNELYKFNFFAFGLQIIIIFISVKFFGLIGVIIGRIISKFLHFILSIYFTKNIS